MNHQMAGLVKMAEEMKSSFDYLYWHHNEVPSVRIPFFVVMVSGGNN